MYFESNGQFYRCGEMVWSLSTDGTASVTPGQWIMMRTRHFSPDLLCPLKLTTVVINWVSVFVWGPLTCVIVWWPGRCAVVTQMGSNDHNRGGHTTIACTTRAYCYFIVLLDYNFISILLYHHLSIVHINSFWSSTLTSTKACWHFVMIISLWYKQI